MAQGVHWGNRIGSWLVFAIAILLVVFVIGTWVDAISRFFAPSLPSDPALANEASLAPDAFSGLYLVNAAITTIPLGAALWGLWHLYRLLAERGTGRTLPIGIRLRNIGLALMAVALLIVGLSYGYAATQGLTEWVPVLPSHIAIFAVGLLLLLWGLWQQHRAARTSSP